MTAYIIIFVLNLSIAACRELYTNYFD